MSDSNFTLPISFHLAASIGLEESVLLGYLQHLAYFQQSHKMVFTVESLVGQLPFWTAPMLMRILSSLQLNQCIEFQRNNGTIELVLMPRSFGEESANKPTGLAGNSTRTSVTRKQNEHPNSLKSEDPLMDKMGQLYDTAKQKLTDTEPKATPPDRYRMTDETPRQQVITPVRQSFAENGSVPTSDRRRGVTDFDLYLEQKERTRQPDQWLPEEATFEQIAQAGITREFAVQLQPEFLLRIKEQRKNVRTWNSEFFKYVKRQWQYKQSDRNSYEGTTNSSFPSKTSREQVSDALTNIHDTDW